MSYLMKILDKPIAIDELKSLAAERYGDLIKAVVDVDRDLLAVDAELHADLEALLLDQGSAQTDLWGINLYPDMPDDEFLEFDSMINIRPSQGNRSRGVDDAGLQKRISAIVEKWVTR